MSIDELTDFQASLDQERAYTVQELRIKLEDFFPARNGVNFYGLEAIRNSSEDIRPQLGDIQQSRRDRIDIIRDLVPYSFMDDRSGRISIYETSGHCSTFIFTTQLQGHSYRLEEFY